MIEKRLLEIRTKWEATFRKPDGSTVPVTRWKTFQACELARDEIPKLLLEISRLRSDLAAILDVAEGVEDDRADLLRRIRMLAQRSLA